MMFDRLDTVADGLFSPELRAKARRSMIRARFAVMHVPLGMQDHVKARIKHAYDHATGYSDGFGAIASVARNFTSFHGVCDLHMSADDTEIEKAAEEYSKAAERIMIGIVKQAAETNAVTNADDAYTCILRIYNAICDWCGHARIPTPDLPKHPNEQDYASAARRMVCPKWWKRRIKREHGRWVEACAIKNGFVGKCVGQPYVSVDALERYRSQRRRNRDTLGRLEVYSKQLDLAFDLIDCIDASISNPVNRRNETMLRLRGIEEWSASRGWRADFITITAPTRFHRWNISQSGKNPAYNDSTPRDAQKWLCKMWSRVRAHLMRLEIDMTGVRIAEPHHDGCPHWHMLVFADENRLDLVQRTIEAYFIDSDPECTPQAQEDRARYGVTVERIDPAQGSAVGYIAKYVSKHIDGTGMSADDRDHDSDLFLQRTSSEVKNNDRPEAIDRVLAWASLWGVRQFQFFASKSVTAWREIRRIDKPPKKDVAIADAWQAANNEDHGSDDRADWRSFCDALERNPVRIITYDADTAYGDTRLSVVGIECGGVEYRTHDLTWEIRRKHVSKNIDAWTCDNNCTVFEKEIGKSPP